MTEPLIQISALGLRYDDTPSPTLRDVNLKINPGELVLLCGPTGCGKTSLALCSNGLVPFATSGTLSGDLRVCGLDPRQTPTPHMAKEVGLVFQDPEGQLCTLFLEDEIAFGAENLKTPRAELAERVTKMLDLVGLQSHRKESVFELSGGQKQKVNIVSVLAMQPRLLVFDMPTANLDPIGSEEVFSVIRELVSDHALTSIIIENRLDDLVPLADRVIVMSADGTIALDGTPAEVFAHARFMTGELGVEIPQVIEIAERLREHGLDVGAGPSLPLTVEALVGRLATLFDGGQLEASRQPSNPERPSTRSSEPIVKLKDVHFGYRRKTEVLKGISFEMPRGELLAIVGNNGSGKTTLVKNLVGLLRPTAGKVTVCGLDVNRSQVAEIAAKAAYVFQYPEHQFVAQGQTVADEIAFNLRTAGCDEAEVERRVAVLVERFQLAGKEKASPFVLSGGEMRTLSVACMLSTQPELLILDEPTYGQDRRRIQALMDRLAELRADGASVIMITHDMRLVAEYATSVLLLSHGRNLFYGRPADLFQRTDLLLEAALKEPPVCAVARGLRERGIRLRAGIVTVPDLFKAWVERPGPCSSI